LRLDASFRASLEAATASFETSLREGGWTAAAYLKARGITREIAACYRLGVVNDKFPEWQQYEGMLCIPYVTKLGGVVSLKFRRPHKCTDECEHAKYISPYSTRLFNPLALEAADREGYVCITEGEFDAIVLDTCGFPAVGIPGVESWKAHPEWVSMLAGVPRVYVFADPDEPGARLGKAICGGLQAARVVRLLGGVDVNESYVKSGRDEFRREVSGIIR
jgi:DNA primase